MEIIFPSSKKGKDRIRLFEKFWRESRQEMQDLFYQRPDDKVNGVNGCFKEMQADNGLLGKYDIL